MTKQKVNIPDPAGTRKNRYNPDVHVQFAESIPEKSLRPFAYLLSRKLMEGHICISEKEVLEDQQVAAYYHTVVIPDWNNLKDWVAGPEEGMRPFIRTPDGRIYLHRYFKYESMIVDRIRSLVERGKQKSANRQKELNRFRDVILALGNGKPPAGATEADERTDWQLVGALQCLLNDFFILTGGPGTGKTTTLARILKILFLIEPQARIRLTAPTGKAATRMKESLADSVKNDPPEFQQVIHDLEATTLHRLLGYRHGHVQFRHNHENPLNYDLVVVDEASMVDIPMMAKLLDAIPEHGRIVLLGDRDQLAPVEAGSLLGDLFQSVQHINSFQPTDVAWLNSFISDDASKISTQQSVSPATGLLADSIVELRFSRRFQQQGDIGKLARAIVRGDRAQLEACMNSAASESLRFEFSDDRILDEFAAGYAEYINEKDNTLALGFLGRLRILATVREGKRGLHEINKRIESFLSSKKLLRIDGEFYENRPILVTRNNYDLGIMNGDVGIVRREEGVPKIWIYQEEQKKACSYLPAYIPHVETNFVMTVHKSQGSEYNRVMVVLPEDADHPLLTRELLYTGITRAKDSVVVFGSRDAMVCALDRRVSRTSGITEYLR